MIQLTRINQKKFYLNPELVENIESCPDTVITLISGKTLMVLESVSLVVKRIMRYKRQIHGLRPLKKRSAEKNNSRSAQKNS